MMQLSLSFPDLGQVTDIRIAHLHHDDARRETDAWRAFRDLIIQNEERYPTIRQWLHEKVAPSLGTARRRAYMAYVDGRPAASAVLKRAASAKICHLRILEQYQDIGLGNILFGLMALDAYPVAQNIHFTLPEGLWDERRAFFASFGFTQAAPASNQYRLFEKELRSSAAAAAVYAPALDKMSRLDYTMVRHEASDHKQVLLSIKPGYMQKILQGTKRIEIRRRFSPCWVGHRAILYASSPWCSLVGEASIAQVIAGTPNEIWAAFGPHIGCTREEYGAYAGVRQEVVAIALQDVHAYARPIARKDAQMLLGVNLHAPQSHAVIEPDSDWSRATAMLGQEPAST